MTKMTCQNIIKMNESIDGRCYDYKSFAIVELLALSVEVPPSGISI